jgi:hypothetical protein
MSVKMNTSVPFLLSSFFSKHTKLTYQVANRNNIMHIVCALSKELSVVYMVFAIGGENNVAPRALFCTIAIVSSTLA